MMMCGKVNVPHLPLCMQSEVKFWLLFFVIYLLILLILKDFRLFMEGNVPLIWHLHTPLYTFINPICVTFSTKG